MDELPPLGRVKPMRVPVGKEDEYGEDARGDPVHLVYGDDEEIPGTVLPSAIPAVVSSDGRQSSGGGSPGFHVDDLNILQNIVTYDDKGHQVVTRVTRADLMTKGTGPAEHHEPRRSVIAADIVRRGAQAEDIFRQATGAALASPPPAGPRSVWGRIPSIEEGGAVMVEAKQGKRGGKAKKTKKAKKRKEQGSEALLRAGESQLAQPLPAPIPVHLTGPFGSITQHFSGIIRQGISLVLVTDHRQIPQAYTPPKATGENPMELQIKWDDQTVNCFWAGIQFSMPDGSVTFTVLLAPESDVTE